MAFTKLGLRTKTGYGKGKRLISVLTTVFVGPSLQIRLRIEFHQITPQALLRRRSFPFCFNPAVHASLRHQAHWASLGLASDLQVVHTIPAWDDIA
jgi:hypothetical protein